MSAGRIKFNTKAVFGALMHSAQYLRGSRNDIVMPNPRFQDPTLHDKSAHSAGVGLYCIHGTADRNGSFLKISNGLLDPTGNPQLSSDISGIHLLAFKSRGTGKDIEFFAEQLRAAINKNGHKHVVLMGHSRGGLVAAYYAEHYAALDGVSVHGAVLVNSPVLGSKLAMKPLSSVSKSVKQMETNSEFINDLSAKIIEANKQKKYYFVASECDSVVKTEASYLKENCHSLYLATAHGHLSVMRSKALIQHIRHCLTQMSLRFFKKELTPAPEEKISESVSDPQSTETLLTTLHQEIDQEIIRITNDIHLISCNAKKRSFTQLKSAIQQRLTANTDVEAKSVGDVIQLALGDLEAESGKPLGELIIEPLNSLLATFKSTEPKSKTFIDNLIKKYNTVPICQVVPSQQTDRGLK